MKNANLANRTAVLFEDILREIVLDKIALRVIAYPRPESVSVSIQCNPTDQGRIIGTRGNHFRSIIALGNCIGAKHGTLVNIDPMPPPTKRTERYDSFDPKEKWRKDEVARLLERVILAVVECDDSVKLEISDEPGAISRALIRVARLEKSSLVTSMTQGVLNPDGSQTGWLRILFNAVGKANGRTIFIEVVADQDGDPRQPEKADGRFTQETRP